MQGLPANDVTIKSRELLPHVFTLSHLAPLSTWWKGIGGEVIFCGTVCLPSVTVSNPAVHRCIALRCPDFPSSRLRQENDSLACSKNLKERITKIITDCRINWIYFL